MTVRDYESLDDLTDMIQCTDGLPYFILNVTSHERITIDGKPLSDEIVAAWNLAKESMEVLGELMGLEP